MQWRELDAEDCSMARTLAVIGDRWTLLVLRECFLRVRRFDEFQERLGIGRPVLANRLQKLVAEFVLTRVAYQQNPLRHEYRLTPKGLDLYPVVMAIVHWGDVHLAGKQGRPLLHRHVDCGQVFDPVTVCSVCHEPLQPRDVRVLPGPGLRHAGRLPVGVQPAAKAKAGARPVATVPAGARPAATVPGGAKPAAVAVAPADRGRTTGIVSRRRARR